MTEREIWKSTLLERVPWLTHGTSTKDWGSLRYPSKEESGDAWKPARELFVSALGGDPERFVLSGNIHGKKVVEVVCPVNRLDACDGLVTDQAGLMLGVKTADCLPIFFVDTRTRRIAIAHAGWKGVMRGIVLEVMRHFHPNVLVALGPSIGNCHYQIHDARRLRMLKRAHILPEDFVSQGEKHAVDLRAMVVRQLLQAGVSRENIDTSAPCTACHQDRFFSYHAERTISNSLLSVIGRTE